jgi:hypothetical protein
MISKSHLAKSFSTQEKKRDGKFSPKKTMSGFTTPLHFSQVGTKSENICSEKKTNHKIIFKTHYLKRKSILVSGCLRGVTMTLTNTKNTRYCKLSAGHLFCKYEAVNSC